MFIQVFGKISLNADITVYFCQNYYDEASGLI